MNKCFIYGRVSRKQAEDSKDSLAKQIQILRRFASKKKFEVENVCSDRSTNNIIGGPGFTHLLAKAINGEIKTILCQDYSRITKNFSDWIIVRWLLKKQGVTIVTTESTNDTESLGKLLEGILSAVDALDRSLHGTKTGKDKQQKKQWL